VGWNSGWTRLWSVWRSWEISGFFQESISILPDGESRR